MAKGAFGRWMYYGRRPNWVARMVNRMAAAVGSLGIASRYGLVTLEVIGRTSGRTISLPVALAVVNGQRYLVSMLGENVQWVRNIRAAGGRAFIRSGSRKTIQCEEVAVDQRAPILKAYLQHVPGARPHLPVDKNAPVADFERIASDYPIFRVVFLASE